MTRKLDILAEWVVWGTLEHKKDLETILLKGHLLLEMILSQILSRNGIDNCELFSFYRKTTLLKNVKTSNKEKLELIIIFLNQINHLRNKLAHEVLYDINNDEFKQWATDILNNFEGTKFTKYTLRTKIIHSFSILSKNILELDNHS